MTFSTIILSIMTLRQLHDDTEYTDTQHSVTRYYDTWHNDIQHNYFKHNDIGTLA
jgi:hypothetical protein